MEELLNLKKLNERGLHDLRAAISEAKVPLSVRLNDAEQRAALAESEANSLKKIRGLLNMFEEMIKDEQRIRENAVDQSS